MKNFSLLIYIGLLGPLAKGQDIILKTDQTEVSAKVVEITTDEVKYKYFNRLDGPVYTLKKSDVSVITYKDGTRERFGAAPASVTDRPSAYSPTPVNTSLDRIASTPGTYTSPAMTGAKRTGLMYGLGYTTPTQAFGEIHGITASSGFYFLGKGRTGGGVLDLDYLYFFGNAPTQYYLFSLNSIFRTSASSRFYMGGGVGYASVSVDVTTYDRYGIKKTTKVTGGDFGGKTFIGYGIVRASFIWPSFQSRSELFTIGFYTNPF